MAKMMSPNTTLWWVTDAAYNPLLPSAAKLTTAANISCAVEVGYNVNPTDSDSDDSATICDESNTEELTAYNYEGTLTIFREGDSLDTTSAFYKAWTFWKTRTNTEGWIVRRLGKKNTAAAAIGDEISSFKFIADDPQDVVEENGPIKATIVFLPQGSMEQYKTAVA